MINTSGLDLNQTNCEMVQCGAISEAAANAAMAVPPGPNMPSMPFASACSAAGWGGPTGGRNCNDPVCTPFIPQIYSAGVSGQGIECCVKQGGTYQANGTCVMPAAASPVPTPSATPMPSATTATMPSITSTAAVVTPQPPPQLTPQNMAQRMPTIVNPAPAVIAPPCSNGLAEWVGDNTLLAVGGLALLAWMVFGKETGRR